MSAPSNCTKCGARMKVAASRRAGAQQVQYLACTSCQHRRSRVVDASLIWRRKS